MLHNSTDEICLKHVKVFGINEHFIREAQRFIMNYYSKDYGSDHNNKAANGSPREMGNALEVRIAGIWSFRSVMGPEDNTYTGGAK